MDRLKPVYSYDYCNIHISLIKMRTINLRILTCMATISLLSPVKIKSQEFQTREIVDNVFIVSNPDLGSQVVVQSDKGLVTFDSFWSGKTARLFKDEILRSIDRSDFSYVIDMVDRLDLIGGNEAMKEAVIIGHENIITKYRNDQAVQEELSELIDMWREKEGYSRNRLQNLEPGSDEAKEEQEWMNQCKSRADDLENDFSIVLPEISYGDQMTLDLGNLSLDLYWFGETGKYSGLTMAVIPEEKLAILSKSILFPVHHLAPNPLPDFGLLDVPRWIALLEEILEGENAVTNIVLSDYDQVISTDLMKSHLHYIRQLWERVKYLEAEGKSLHEIQDQLSLEKEFAFVKDMELYKNHGDFWVRPQHELHIKLFFLQGKLLASEIIKNGGVESIQVSLEKVKSHRNDLYFDEQMLNRIAYVWMDKGHVSEAIEVYKLNADSFPHSFNAQNSLAEAYLRKGDTTNALKSFEKSLELDPENEGVQKALKELSR